MANPPKAKGTKGETELLRHMDLLGLVRTPPGTEWDLALPPQPGYETLDVLATRPDRGRWLVTLDLDDFLLLWEGQEDFGLRVEVKRYRRFAHHTIFESKFGRGV